MKHACEGCAYYYLGDYDTSKTFYNALSEVTETHHTTLEDQPCCGISAGGKALDKNNLDAVSIYLWEYRCLIILPIIGW